MKTPSHDTLPNTPSASVVSPVACVVVTFEIGRDLLPVLEAILPQVDRVFVVDNGSGGDTQDVLRDIEVAHPERVEVIRNGENLGIAAGLNIGIRRALEQGHAWVLTLDHDSVAAPDMVANLFLTHAEVADRNPGILSPTHIDGSTGRKYRYPVFGKFFFRHVTPTDRPLSCSFCISSGCLIPKRTFETAGLFQEEYFVYAVDTEFCRRVLRHGYSIFISEKATLVHREGGGRKTDLGIFQLRTPDWSARSLYYIFRNVTYDLRTNPVFSWRIHEGLFLARALITLLLANPPDRNTHWAAVRRGISDGIKGRLGKSAEY
jgi:rhamnosyltransferase